MAVAPLSTQVLSVLANSENPLNFKEISNTLKEDPKRIHNANARLLATKDIKHAGKKDGLLLFAATAAGKKKTGSLVISVSEETMTTPFRPGTLRSKIVEFIKKKGDVSSVEVAEYAGINTAAAGNHLKKIFDKGLITKSGGGSKTRYQYSQSTSTPEKAKRKYTKRKKVEEVPEFNDEIAQAVSALGQVAVQNEKLRNTLRGIKTLIENTLGE